MRTFLAILFAALCATSHGQTMKALAFNTSNGVVVSGTNLSFTSPVSFSTLAFTNITASNITLNGVLAACLFWQRIEGSRAQLHRDRCAMGHHDGRN
jgi:hypothetical protein